MVVLAPGTPIKAEDIPADITEGYGTLLPARIGHVADRGGSVGGPEFEFILRSLMELRVQVEELRRRLEEGGGPEIPMELIDVGEGATLSIPVGAVGAVDPDEEEAEAPVVVWREGMTMADVERATIEAVLHQQGGNRRRAAQLLAIGERTLYRKLKEYDIA
jgi:DNA-binding NtrC family response regulator